MTTSNSLRLSSPSEPYQKRINAPRRSYVLSQNSGEGLVIPSSNSVARLPAGKEQTDGAFAVATSHGAGSEPIVPHMHKGAHDTFLCLRGSLQVWCNNESRVLQPGDYASVPPLAIHSYAQRGIAHNEFFGVIAPGGWEEFFRKIGDEASEDTVLFPTGDQAPFPVQRFIAAIKEGHDVIPQHGHQLVEAQPFTEKDVIPSGSEPYFLKADTGPRYLLGGQQLEVLTYPHNTNGQFSLAWLEGSSKLQGHFLGDNNSTFSFENAATYLRVIDGFVELEVASKEGDSYSTFTEKLSHGEAALVAAGDGFRVNFTSPYGRVLVATGSAQPKTLKGGLESLFTALGQKVEKHIVFGGPAEHNRGPQVDAEKVREWAQANEASIINA